MNFLAFQAAFESFPVIGIAEIERHFPGFDRNNLTRWQNKGYIQKLRNGFYRLSRQPTDSSLLFLIAGRLYAPSYISLESALSHYGLIPEGVFSFTSVSTLKTCTFHTPLARFEYRHLKTSLFFGARLETSGAYQYKIADPVKALLDFLYLRPDIYETGHLEELRLDLRALSDYIRAYPVQAYLEHFGSATLDQKFQKLQKMLLL